MIWDGTVSHPDPARATAARAPAVARCALVACCHWDDPGPKRAPGGSWLPGTRYPNRRVSDFARWAGARNPGELPPKLIDARNAARECDRSRPLLASGC